jgi:signal transduction histidine kinase
MKLAERVREAGESFAGLGDPVYWALGIGLLLTQGRTPVRDNTVAEVAILMVQITALKMKSTRRAPALLLSVVTELVACATGVAPNIGIGAVVVCAANLYRNGEPRRVQVVVAGADVSGAVFGVIAVVSSVPWLLRWPAGAVFEGRARATSPWETALLLLFAIGLRANWNFIDTLVRGASQRAAEAEAAKDKAVAEERSRIARELHDVVAHQMSVVVAQAQGAEAVVGSDPTRARVALQTIAGTTREALVELRRLLGIVRQDRGESDARFDPQPGLIQLQVLAMTGKAAGLDVRIEVTGPFDTVPPAVALSVYRIAQEAITNAAKHAPGSRVDVGATVTGGSVEVSVVNGPGRHRSAGLPGAGAGLAGMRERVELFGGTLVVGPTTEGGWSVVARFPTLDTSPRSE